MHIPLHPPWTPGYINVTQTGLIILMMVVLFLGTPPIYGMLYNKMLTRQLYLNKAG